MILENLRRSLSSMAHPETLEEVYKYYGVLSTELRTLNLNKLGDTPVTERQYIVYNNSLNYLATVIAKGKYCNYVDDLCRSVSECYDIVHNYMNTNHIVSINEYCLLRSIEVLWGRVLEVI